jgi:hypothetical protein
MNSLRQTALKWTRDDIDLLRLSRALNRARGRVKQCDTNRRKALKGKSKLWPGYAEVEREWEVKRADLRREVDEMQSAYRAMKKEVYAKHLVDARRHWLKQVQYDKFHLGMPDARTWSSIDAEERHFRWHNTIWALITQPPPAWKAVSPFAAEVGTSRMAVRLETGHMVPARAKVRLAPWRKRKDRVRAIEAEKKSAEEAAAKARGEL